MILLFIVDTCTTSVVHCKQFHTLVDSMQKHIPLIRPEIAGSDCYFGCVCFPLVILSAIFLRKKKKEKKPASDLIYLLLFHLRNVNWTIPPTVLEDYFFVLLYWCWPNFLCSPEIEVCFISEKSTLTWQCFHILLGCHCILIVRQYLLPVSVWTWHWFF